MYVFQLCWSLHAFELFLLFLFHPEGNISFAFEFTFPRSILNLSLARMMWWQERQLRLEHQSLVFKIVVPGCFRLFLYINEQRIWSCLLHKSNQICDTRLSLFKKTMQIERRVPRMTHLRGQLNWVQSLISLQFFSYHFHGTITWVKWRGDSRDRKTADRCDHAVYTSALAVWGTTGLKKKKKLLFAHCGRRLLFHRSKRITL